MSYSEPPPPADEPKPTGSTPPPPPQEPAAPPPPEPAPAQPPAAAPSASSPSTAGMSADDLKRAVQEADKFDIGIIVLGIVAFLLSFFPYYTYDFGGVSGDQNAWSGFFGWFAALLALAAAGLVAAQMLGVRLLEPSLMRLSVLGGFAVALLCIVLALFVVPDSGPWDEGHGFGYWASAIIVIGGVVLSFLRKDATD
jgi:hypothetical protein